MVADYNQPLTGEEILQFLVLITLLRVVQAIINKNLGSGNINIIYLYLAKWKREPLSSLLLFRTLIGKCDHRLLFIY